MEKTKFSIFESPEGMQALITKATVGIIVLDEEHSICTINPFALQIFGYEENELAGKFIETLIPFRYREKHVNHRNGYMSDPKPRQMGSGLELYGLRKDRTEVPVAVSLGPFEFQGNNFVVCFVNDITEEIEADKLIKNYTEELEEQVIQRTKDLLEKLEKEKSLNEIKSSFVSMASHELRTPLTAILSSANLASKYNNESETEKRLGHIQKIRSSVNSLIEILDEFLSLGKLDSGKAENEVKKNDIPIISKELIKQTSGLRKKGQHIQYEHKGRKDFLIDHKMLSHVVVNLLSNAIKYSDDQIKFTTKIDNNRLYINVSDMGIGIPEKEQGKLFEIFFRANNSCGIQGTGLGLHIVKKYVDLMDGYITFTSKENKGTTFNIEIPEKRTL